MKNFIFLLLLLFPLQSFAVGAYDVLMNPKLGSQRTSLSFHLDASNGTTSIVRESLGIFTPVWSGTETEVGLTASGEMMSLGEKLALPSSGDLLPDLFSELQFGPTVRHKFSNGWIAGANAFAGSSSNKPFAAFNTLEVTGNAALLIPSGTNEMWVFFLNYSSNRDFLRHVPLPGFGYFFNREWGRGIIGAPAMNMTFLPKSKINFSVRYFPIIRVYADAGWSPQRFARLAGYFEWNDDHFWRTGRTIKNRQIFLVEKTIGGSFLLKPHKDIDLKASGGWKFNRYIFEGRSIVKDTGYNRIKLESTPFAGVDVLVRI